MNKITKMQESDRRLPSTGHASLHVEGKVSGSELNPSDHISRAQLDRIMLPMMELISMSGREAQVTPMSFHVPLTATTSAEVKFHGPVGIEEYDALLAHIAFYKLLVPKKTEPKFDGQRLVDKITAVVKKIWEDRESVEMVEGPHQ